MKKFLIVCAFSVLFIGCVPKSELEKAKGDIATAQERIKVIEQQLQSAQQELAKNPPAFIGTWRCQTTLVSQELLGKAPQAHDVTLTLNPNGSGSLMWLINRRQADAAVGPWVKTGDYLIIERVSSGFGAFKVVSKSDTKMTVVNRAGLMLEFTKIK